VQCALCKAGVAKEDSHIIPAFVFRWLKDSSPTGFLRRAAEPNKRLQDGPKKPLLCGVCEDRLSKLETEFANRVFREVHHASRGGLAFDYSEWFHRFCVSISWRVLTHLVERHAAEHLPHAHAVSIAEALERWRLYLLEQAPDVDRFTQHFLILDVPISATNMGQHDLQQLARFIKRAVYMEMIPRHDECYVFSKLCDIVIVGTISDPKPQQWVRTGVSPISGHYEPGSFQASACLAEFFAAGFDEFRKTLAGVSSKQTAKIMQTFQKRFPGAKING
jgi:hypothetical protein